MDNVKNDNYYLEKMISDLPFLVKRTRGKTRTAIEKDELLIDSIMFRIVQIAENANKLSDSFKNKYNNISWVEIRGLRNRIVHDYGVTDMTIIYNTVINDIPKMYDALLEISKDGCSFLD